MSKTFRRKNYEDTQGASWDRGGRKRYGYYAQHDYVCSVWNATTNEYVSEGYWYYREATTAEMIKEFWRVHGESRSAQEWSPGRDYRKIRNKENRSITRHELFKFMKNPDEYEPMVEANPRDCHWDWI